MTPLDLFFPVLRALRAVGDNFLIVYFSVTFGSMLVAIVVAYWKYGPDAFKAFESEEEETDFDLDRKMRELRKWRK